MYIRTINFDNSVAFLTLEDIVHASISNLTVTDISLSSDSTIWIVVYGLDTELAMNGLYMLNLDLYKSPAVDLKNTFSSITMNNLHFENVTIDGDISMIIFETIKIMFLDGAIFKNISISSESVNNFMIQIDQTGKAY